MNSTHHENRQRFTIGHELEHFFLHDRDCIHVDRRFEIKLRNAKSSEGTEDEEKEANLFASELLLPKRLLDADITKVQQLDLEDEPALVRLAEQYAASVPALSFRLAYLGLVKI